MSNSDLESFFGFAAWNSPDSPSPTAPQAVVGVQVETEPTWHKDCITLTALQLRHALDFAAPDFDTDEDQRETEVSIAWAPAGATHTDEGDPDPAGYKVWLTDYPEEGSIPLDESPAGFPVKSAERGCAIAAAARAALAAAPTPPVDGGTCDAPLCEEHAYEVSPDRHLCPRHRAEQQRATPELF